MTVETDVLSVLLDDLPCLARRANANRNMHFIGAISALDSVAAVKLIATLEQRFGIVVDDDDIDGGTFAAVAMLANFVSSELAA